MQAFAVFESVTNTKKGFNEASLIKSFFGAGDVTLNTVFAPRFILEQRVWGANIANASIRGVRVRDKIEKRI